MSDAWETNCTLGEVADWIRTRDRVAVLTHLKPDGDALGSAIGACRAIRMGTGGRTGADAWFAEGAWEQRPSEQYAEAVVEVVLGKRRRTQLQIQLTPDALRVVAGWLSHEQG